MELSVVIPTYNQATLLIHCLEALTRQTLPSGGYEVVVVDDGSTDDTPAILARFQDGPMRLRSIRINANRGRSAARNAGIRDARGTIIVFLDSDVIVDPGFLAAHLEAHRGHGLRTLTRGPVVHVTSPERASRARPPRVAASPAFLDAANAGVARTTLLEAGLFDEAFPGYGWEDFDLGQRLKRLGVRRVFCPEAVAWHLQPLPQPGDLNALLRKERERARSGAYFLRKNPTLETRWLVQWTALHRAVYWAMAVGGWLRPERALGVASRMRQSGKEALGHLILRAALNQHYLELLRQELRGDVVLA